MSKLHVKEFTLFEYEEQIMENRLPFTIPYTQGIIYLLRHDTFPKIVYWGFSNPANLAPGRTSFTKRQCTHVVG